MRYGIHFLQASPGIRDATASLRLVFPGRSGCRNIAARGVGQAWQHPGNLPCVPFPAIQFPPSNAPLPSVPLPLFSQSFNTSLHLFLFRLPNRMLPDSGSGSSVVQKPVWVSVLYFKFITMLLRAANRSAAPMSRMVPVI